jgi:transcription initiation factor TFIIIB Brf1 subunit/transcription initiation factor TFIIB
MECLHENEVTENNVRVCMNCGEVLNSVINFNREWYSECTKNNDGKSINRTHSRQVYEKSIFKDVEHMKFTTKIENIANNIFYQIDNDKIKRGRKRKSVIFGCIYNSYKIMDKVRGTYDETNSFDICASFENLLQIFDITKKQALKGIRLVTISIPKDSQARQVYVTPKYLISEYMQKFNATDKQILEVYDLYKQIENKSTILNGARPKSICSGLIYYYILKTNRKIPLKTFKKTVNLSELTILKYSIEIGVLLEK